jgi:small subunit ribosomal protein S27e
MRRRTINLVTMPKSRFLRVLCEKCKNDQTIYNKAAKVVKCLKCGEELAVPTGGEAIIKGKILEVLS